MTTSTLQISPSDPRDAASALRGKTIATQTLGKAWLDVAQAILEQGASSSFKGLPMREIELVTLEISQPDPNDAVIAKNAPADWLAWMRKNFTDHSRVAELGNARSYASRLFDYGASGRNQLDWVVEKLTKDPLASYATITTFEPLTDTTYIPCVSLLDFWLRAGGLDLVVYAHSIDFGKKGFANLVQLAELQTYVAEHLKRPEGRLTMIIKSAHIYATEIDHMTNVVKTARS